MKPDLEGFLADFEGLLGCEVLLDILAVGHLSSW